MSKRRMSGASVNRSSAQLKGSGWLNQPRNSGEQSGNKSGATYNIPAPGVPHIHLRLVVTAKSIMGALTSKGNRPAPWVISTPIRLPMRRPCATNVGRLMRWEVVDDVGRFSATYFNDLAHVISILAITDLIILNLSCRNGCAIQSAFRPCPRQGC